MQQMINYILIGCTDKDLSNHIISETLPQMIYLCVKLER